MPHRIAFAAAIALIAAAAIADDPDWRDIVVRFDIHPDGSFHVKDRLEVSVPMTESTISRTYWTDERQHVTVDRVVRVTDDGGEVELQRGHLDRAGHFVTPNDGTVAWSVRDKTDVVIGARSYIYIVESTVSNALIPAWSIPHGRMTHDEGGQFADPRQRLREILPFWRAARTNLRSRFLVDYLYEMPPPATPGTSIQLQLFWPDGWSPVQELTGDTIGREIKRNGTDPDSWRVMHLFDYQGKVEPKAIDLQAHVIRAASILLFPIIALLLWLIFLAREIWRHRNAPSGEVTEQNVRESVYNHPPEVIETLWSGRAGRPGIESFLRRLERERKLAIEIKELPEDADDEYSVKLRLLAQRENLTPYERAGVDALMPAGREITSEEIQKQHAESEFDPADALEAELKTIARAGEGRPAGPLFSNALSLIMFWSGLALVIYESFNHTRDPYLFLAVLGVSVVTRLFWPTSLVRYAVRNSRMAALILLIPILVTTAAVALVHMVRQIPLGPYASIGVSLMLLSAFTSRLSQSAASESTAAAARRAELTRARSWMLTALQNEPGRIRDEQLPWFHALGLKEEVARYRPRPAVTDGDRDDDQETWGWSLST